MSGGSLSWELNDGRVKMPSASGKINYPVLLSRSRQSRVSRSDQLTSNGEGRNELARSIGWRGELYNEPALQALYDLIPQCHHEVLNKWVKEWVKLSYCNQGIPLHPLFECIKDDNPSAFKVNPTIDYLIPKVEEVDYVVKRVARKLTDKLAREPVSPFCIKTSVEKSEAWSNYVVSVSLLGLRRSKK